MSATTQYGDMRGTVAIDGYDGDFLNELRKYAKVPKGKVPVGIELYSGEPGEKKPFISMSLLVADMDKVGFTGDEQTKHAKTHGSVTVSKVDLDIKLKDLLKLIKRLDIVVSTRTIEDAELQVTGGR